MILEICRWIINDFLIQRIPTPRTFFVNEPSFLQWVVLIVWYNYEAIWRRTSAIVAEIKNWLWWRWRDVLPSSEYQLLDQISINCANEITEREIGRIGRNETNIKVSGWYRNRELRSRSRRFYPEAYDRAENSLICIEEARTMREKIDGIAG